jgi:hypothetical protein
MVDVEASGSDMVDQPDKARKAWLDAERDAAQLTKLAATLEAAAHLAGVHISDESGRLALCCDPAGKYRRRPTGSTGSSPTPGPHPWTPQQTNGAARHQRRIRLRPRRQPCTGAGTGAGHAAGNRPLTEPP